MACYLSCQWPATSLSATSLANGLLPWYFSEHAIEWVWRFRAAWGDSELRVEIQSCVGRFRAAWGDSELHVGSQRDSEFGRGRAFERYANAQVAVGS